MYTHLLLNIYLLPIHILLEDISSQFLQAVHHMYLSHHPPTIIFHFFIFKCHKDRFIVICISKINFTINNIPTIAVRLHLLRRLCYKDWYKIGGGLANKNLLCYGDFPAYANDMSEKSLVMPNGAVIDGKFDQILPVDLKDPNQIKEFVDHSWYSYPKPDEGLHPWEGITDPNFDLGKAGVDYEGTKTDIKWLTTNARYSWIKAPRWNGHAMETGPLARMVVAYAKKMPRQKELVDRALAQAGVPVEALFSTLGRTLCRGLEAKMCAQLMLEYVDELEANIKAGDEVAANMDKWEPSTWPKECKGVGQCEAPRGALGHWCVIKDGVIENWQAVVPTTWNASPRDTKGQLGAYEAALLGTPVAVADQPLEILRTIHSFDPCLACATHVMSTSGEELCKVQVR